MYRRPGTGSGPGLWSCSVGTRGLPPGSQCTGLVLTHPTPLLAPLFRCRSTSSSPPFLLCFLTPRERSVRLPGTTTVSLTPSVSFSSSLVIDGAPSRFSRLPLCPHRICDFLVSLRLRGDPWWCPVPPSTQAYGFSGCSLPPWPISLATYGLPFPSPAGSSVDVGPVIPLYLHSPPLPQMPSGFIRSSRHLVLPLPLGPRTLVTHKCPPGPNGCLV